MKWLSVFALFLALVAAENPEENVGVYDPDLFEGDMIFTPEQRMAAEKGLDVDNLSGRASIKSKLWPNGVMNYEIDSSLSGNSQAMAAIRAGMQEWTSKTCIRFKRGAGSSYAYFKKGGGCSSYVGKNGGRQDITLASGCWTRGIVAHEIGHALGFFHEQSRPDRDNYVTIMWDNIIEANKFNFQKYGRGTIDSLGTGYDYGSVMHYQSTAFTKNGKPTIVSKRPGITLGQRRGLSSIDARQMDLLYKKECQGGGGGGCKDSYHAPCQKFYCHYQQWAKKNCRKTCNMC